MQTLAALFNRTGIIHHGYTGYKAAGSIDDRSRAGILDMAMPQQPQAISAHDEQQKNNNR